MVRAAPLTPEPIARTPSRLLPSERCPHRDSQASTSPASRVVTGVPSRPSAVPARTCQPAESGGAGCVMFAFLPRHCLLTDPNQPQPHAERAASILIMYRPAADPGHRQRRWQRPGSRRGAACRESRRRSGQDAVPQGRLDAGGRGDVYGYTWSRAAQRRGGYSAGQWRDSHHRFCQRARARWTGG
jgi:hypothetical protein